VASQISQSGATRTERDDARVARTRAAVLEAGARLLFTEGWDAVTHVRIAEDSGVGRATVYRHWPTTEDLLSEVLIDCQAPLESGEPTGDTRTDLISEITVFVDALRHSRLPEVLITAMERGSAGSLRIQAMHESMTRISRRPVWDVVCVATQRDELDAGLTEEIVGAYLLGPLLYLQLFDGREVGLVDIERTVDAFLGAFAS